MDKPAPPPPPKPDAEPAPTYMTPAPGSDRDSLGRPWPDVQVKARKVRRRKSPR